MTHTITAEVWQTTGYTTSVKGERLLYITLLVPCMKTGIKTRVPLFIKKGTAADFADLPAIGSQVELTIKEV